MYEEILDILFDSIPYVFWKDTNGKYQGGNLNQARNLGFKSPSAFIGKTIFEILKDKKTAQLIDEVDNKVMREDITLVNEEKIVELSGEKIYLSQKSPIHNDKGVVVGMIGFAMDITEIKQQEELAKQERDNLIVISAQKETERLKLESEAHKVQLEAGEHYKKIVDQAAHDLGTPLSALTTLAAHCSELLEDDRILLRNAVERILDIAHYLLNHYKPQDNGKKENFQEEKQLILGNVPEVFIDKI